jgi:acyl phosphate:glycerol-3-phosphate acyltransferase
MIEMIAALVIGYLLGSVNCAILVCQYIKKGDPRQQGSKNPGATNVLRVAGKNAAIITLLGDGLKGFLAVFAARLFGLHGAEIALVGLAAFLGHLYPVYFKFQGGKGVATFLGVLLGLHLLLGVAAAVTWVVVAMVWRYSSLAALIAAITAPFYSVLFFHNGYFVPLLIMAILLIYRHRENIARLRAGKESKINSKKEPALQAVKKMAEQFKDDNQPKA